MKNNDDERRFTLRITEEESKKIESLKKLLDLNTDSAVIRFLINHYENLLDNFEQKVELYDKLSDEYSDLESAVSAFVEAEEILKNAIKKIV